MITVTRTLKATLDRKAIRSEQFDGREHLVVPVIALIGDMVIEAMGSEGPEFVPLEELEKSVSFWNNRPVMSDHPAEGSANSPDVLQRQGMGSIFNTKIEDKKLKFENWIDVSKVEALGGEPLDTLQRLRNGEVVETSIGANVAIVPRDMEIDGKKIIGQWSNIIPDHNALLPRGAIGACSVAMGCGTRTARKKEDRQAMLAHIRNLLSDKGISDRELQRKLYEAVGELPLSSFGIETDKVNAEYWGIEAVYQESSTCISIFWVGDNVRFFRHRYRMTGMTVEITGKPEEVTPIEPRFETLESVQSDNDPQDNKPQDKLTSKGETQVADKPDVKVTSVAAGRDQATQCNNTDNSNSSQCCERKARLVARLLELSSFTEADKPKLEAMDIGMLENFLKPYESAEEVVEEPAATTSSDTDTNDSVTVSSAWKKQADAAIAWFNEQQATERSEAIAALKGKVSFTDEDLKKLDNRTLRTLAADFKKLEDQTSVKPKHRQANYSLQAPADTSADTPAFKPAPLPYSKEVN